MRKRQQHPHRCTAFGVVRDGRECATAALLDQFAVEREELARLRQSVAPKLPVGTIRVVAEYGPSTDYVVCVPGCTPAQWRQMIAAITEAWDTAAAAAAARREDGR